MNKIHPKPPLHPPPPPSPPPSSSSPPDPSTSPNPPPTTIDVPKQNGQPPDPTLRKRVTLHPTTKKLSNASQKLAWDHYLATRPLRDESIDQALGFDIDEQGNIIRDPSTGKPSSSCCGRNASVRSVAIQEFTDLGPGLALTFRWMEVSTKFFFGAFLLSSIGWIVQMSNPKNSAWVTVSWAWDLIFTVGFIAFMCWLRRDMVLADQEVDGK
jgi:hypothetical protein